MSVIQFDSAGLFRTQRQIRAGCSRNKTQSYQGGNNMSLNINLTSPTTPNSLSNYGNHASLENTFNTLRQKSFINEGSGLKVEFTAKYNSNLTAYLANGQVSTLLHDLQPNDKVHRLKPEIVTQLT
jgi:hypothetical protein